MARRTKAEALATREALLDAAERVFEQRGVTRSTLADIAATCGERRDSVREWLDSSADTDKVQRMVAGVRKQGIEGVPFYILNRKLAVSGAQSAAVLGAALLQSLETGKPS